MQEQKAPTQDPVFQAGMKIISFLKQYHRYDVHGLEKIPKSGPALIVINHSLATYDIIMLASEIYLQTGRYCVGLADRRIFQTPGIAQFFSRLKAVMGTPEVGQELLAGGNLVLISPGGMRESLRSSNEKYRVDWEGRYGFVRLAIKSQVPVILAACPAADDIYTLYENPVTTKVYQKLKWPLPILRGWGLSLLPRPVKLDHFLSGPFQAPELQNGEVNEEEVQNFHALLRQEIHRLMRS